MNVSLFPKGSNGRYLGIDIGHDFIKVVEVEIGRNRVKVVNAGMAPTPLHTMAEGLITNPEEIATTLRGLLSELGTSAREAICGVTGATVIVRPITVPRQKPAELAESVVFEAQKYISTAPEDNYIEAPILPEQQGTEPGPEMACLLVSAPRSMVDGRVIALEMAGLEPVAVDINALAAIRALLPPDASYLSSATPPTVAFVDLGASYTDVTIVQGNVPVFPRTIPIGGTSFTNALAGVMGVGFEEAQQIKHGLNEYSEESDPTATRVIDSLLEELVRDIRRSLAYYASTMDWESIEGLIDRVVLLGGGSKMAHTADYFANVLQMNVVAADLPTDGTLQVDPEIEGAFREQFPFYTVALGLALWPVYSRVEK